jgi:hypothetical protein
MAHAKEKGTMAIKSKTLTPKSPAPVLEEVASSHYAIAPDTTEVRQWSETEAASEKGLRKTMVHAEVLAERWQERLKKDGKKVWVNPFEPRNKRTHYPTKAACQKVMNTQFKMQIEQARLTKQPEHTYTPQPQIISPKRRLEDVVPPGQAKIMKAAMEVAKTNVPQRIGKAIPRTTSTDELTANRVLKMVESEAMDRMEELSVRELTRLVDLAEAYGKRQIMKAAKVKLAAMS